MRRGGEAVDTRLRRLFKRRAPEVAAPGEPSASPVDPVAEAADGVSVEPALAGKPEPAVEPAPEPMIEPATDEPGQEPVREKVRTLPPSPGCTFSKTSGAT